jgi:hypothetical protein
MACHHSVDQLNAYPAYQDGDWYALAPSASTLDEADPHHKKSMLI